MKSRIVEGEPGIFPYPVGRLFRVVGRLFRRERRVDWRAFDRDEPEETPWGPWHPLPIDEAAALLGRFGARSWIAGGWAMDLFLGRPTRAHSDIDVFVLREDQDHIHDLLPTWDLSVADPPGTLRAWPRGETLALPLQDIWARPSPTEPWRLQFMLGDRDGDDWVFKRDAAVRRRLDDIGWRGPLGLTVMRPEIALLHKGTGSQGKPDKDDADFAAVAGRLEPAAREWLDDTLRRIDPSHRWISA